MYATRMNRRLSLHIEFCRKLQVSCVDWICITDVIGITTISERDLIEIQIENEVEVVITFPRRNARRQRWLVGRQSGWLRTLVRLITQATCIRAVCPDRHFLAFSGCVLFTSPVAGFRVSIAKLKLSSLISAIYKSCVISDKNWKHIAYHVPPISHSPNLQLPSQKNQTRVSRVTFRNY